ncbi:MAG: WYL domain-containing protein [Deltaproteobacteria bacterium]|nr:MAG: WYL domain-containing protein [Deltaproteobacteria bacterium]
MARDQPEQPLAFNLARIVHRLLTDPLGWRVDTLKAELGIADRTYRKYRQLLQEFPAFRRADGATMVEQVDDGHAVWLRLLTPSTQDVREGSSFLGRIAAMYLAQQMFSFLRHTPVGDNLEAFFADLRARTRDGAFVYRDLLINADRMFHLLPHAPKDYSDRSAQLTMLLNALLFRREIRIEYFSASSGTERAHVLEPLTLLSWRSALYLIARRPGQKKTRTFAIDRIRAITVRERTFVYPGPDEYDPRHATEGAFGLYNETARRKVGVDLVFADEPWLKAELTERRWHPSQRFQELPDGRLRMTFRVTTMVEVWPWIRSFGPRVSIVAPDPADDPVAVDLVPRVIPAPDPS